MKSGRVLILSNGRSGSGSLMGALCDVLETKGITEPFNEEYWNEQLKKDIPNVDDVLSLDENIIIKHIHMQNEEWVENNIEYFDKVIVLIRDNIKDHILSSKNALTYGYDNPYYSENEIYSPDDLFISLDSYSIFHKFLTKHYALCNVFWYSDFFETKEKCLRSLKKLRLGIDQDASEYLWEKYFNPKHRLKRHQ